MSFDYKQLFLITYFLHFLTCKPKVLGLFTLSTSLDFKSSLTLSLFLHIIIFYSDKKKSTFLSIFVPGPIFFETLKKVLFSREVSEGSIVLTVLNEGSAQTYDTSRESVIEVDSKQARAIFGGAVSIGVIVSLALQKENKYSSTPLRLKG
jgi:hypothetical protein